MGKITDRIKMYIAERLAAKLELFDKEADKSRETAATAENFEQWEVELQVKRQELIVKFQVQNWLRDAAKRAGQINLVTHAAKYTHSDTRSTGVLFDSQSKSVATMRYLNSAVCSSLTIDVVGNAAVLDVARLLQLESDGKMLLDEVAQGDSPSLRALAENDIQYQDWIDGFQAAFQSQSLQSGQLAKQLYFPVGENEYHLIGPLFASSLMQAVYQRVDPFSEETKAAREARKKEQYHAMPYVVFPQMAIQSFGGTKPQNISQLNTQRYGKGYLFSCQPPVWKQQDFLPSKGQKAFWKEFDRRSWSIVRKLQQHLASHFKRTSTMAVRHQRAQLVDDLIDLLLQLSAEVQSKKELAGWSITSDLPREEQLWLDPYRAEQDERFAQERSSLDWQKGIASSFAFWLNRNIDKADKNKKTKVQGTLKTGEDEFNEWHRLMEEKLRLLREDLEVSL